MPLPLYHEWRAYSKIDPFARWRGDFGFAAMTAHIVNAVIGVHGVKRRYRPRDFMPKYYRPKGESGGSMFARLKAAVKVGMPVDDRRNSK